jgi:LuxR family maltose regulon positive regulatory protein
LLANRETRLVTLIAAPGYGKSTTLALWRARESRPTAWLTLDGQDADPLRFVVDLAVAIDRAIALDRVTLDSLEAPGISALSAAVPRLTTALHRAATPLVIMLDDVHRLDGTGSVDVLAMIVDYLPTTMLIAVAGRSDAGLPLARYRAAGHLLELTEADLAFDERESAEFIGLHDGRLTPDAVRELQAATEGWPAAVYLAITSSRRRPTTETAPTVISGRDPDIARYLDEELLGRTNPAVRRFLMQTSVLGRMSGDLCDAVTGRRGSDGVLRQLAATNHLVTPLDAAGGWYRYHTLLAEHLQGSLATGGVDPRVLHRRAADWYAEHGMTDDAIDHHLAAGDVDAAARRMTAVALHWYRTGHGDTLARRLASLTDADLHRHPLLAAVAAWTHVLEGRPAAADRMADVLETARYEGKRPDGAEAYEAARASLLAMMARSGLRSAVADAESAVTVDARSSPWRPAVLGVFGSILAVSGDPSRADAVLREAIAAASEVGAGRALVSGWSWRAMLAIERSDWTSARTYADEASGAVGRLGFDADVTVASAAAVAARVALQHGASNEAGRHLARFHVARPALGMATPWISIRSLLEASRAHLAVADPAGARALLRQAEDIAVRQPDLGDLPAQVAELAARIRGLPPGPGGASTLTPAEIRVLRLLPTYLSVHEIAQRLFVTSNTIRTQIQAIYGKLGASSRSEAVELAVRAGLVEPLPILASGDITPS